MTPDFPALTGQEWKSLYRLANAHDLAHLVADAVQKEQIALPADIASALEQKQLLAVFRYEQQQYEFQSICAVLEQAEIPYIPLKGLLLRNYYPEGWMRTSADLDLLVQEADLNRAIALLQEQLYYKREYHESTHEYTLVSPSGVILELHYNICEPGRANNADAVLRCVWDYAQVESGCRYVLDDAMFYFYQIAHAAKHIQNGGCGIRPFLDLWLYNQKNPGCKEKRDELLSEGSLSEFEQVCGQLCECWFNGAPLDERTEKLQRYIIDGGTYGTAERGLITSMTLSKGNKNYLLKRIFLPKELLKGKYPVLEARAWLTPFFEVYRWAQVLWSQKKQKRIANEMKLLLDKEKQQENTSLFDLIGL